MGDPTLDVRIAQAHDAIRTHLAAEESARGMADEAHLQVSDEIQVSLHCDGLVEIMLGGTGLIMQDEERRKLYEWVVADARARDEVPRAGAAVAMDSEDMSRGWRLIDEGYQGLRGRYDTSTKEADCLNRVRIGLLLLADGDRASVGDLAAPTKRKPDEPSGGEKIGPEQSEPEDAGDSGDGPLPRRPSPGRPLPWRVCDEFHVVSCNELSATEEVDSDYWGFICDLDARYAVASANAMQGRDPSKLAALEQEVTEVALKLDDSFHLRTEEGWRAYRHVLAQRLTHALKAFRGGGSDG